MITTISETRTDQAGTVDKDAAVDVA